MKLQAINYRPIKQVSFAGEKEKQEKQIQTEETKVSTPHKKSSPLVKGIKIIFILGSAIASYGVFKTLAPDALKAIMTPIRKVVPKGTVTKGINNLTKKPFMEKAIGYIKYPFEKINQGINFARKPLVTLMENKTPKILKNLTSFRNWCKTQMKEFIANTTEIQKLKQSMFETGSVISAIGGGAVAADMVSSHKVTEV